MAALFETVTCSRCGGSGQYSYCQTYGHTCFKCRGNKVVLTKRGVAAQMLYRRLLSKTVGSLLPGDKVMEEGIPGFAAGGWCTVKAVVPTKQSSPNYAGAVDVEYSAGPSGGHHGMRPENVVRVAASRQQKQNAAAVALAYQAVLSKSGKEPAWLKTIAWG